MQTSQTEMPDIKRPSGLKVLFFWNQGKGVIHGLLTEIISMSPVLIQISIYCVKS